MSDPYTKLANILEQVILSEFQAEEPYLNLRHDRCHESLGSDGRLYVGISPGDRYYFDIEEQMVALIQWYGPFEAKVDPNQQIDPRLITAKADKLKNALAAVRTTAFPELWYFDILSLRFPNDATGNKTRFEMEVIGRGNNTGLIETI